MSEIIGVGIDLGTTYSCVAVCQNGQVTTCFADDGNYVMPSIVCFTETDKLVGAAAEKEAPMHLESTIYDTKRLIGKSFDDQKVKEDMKDWPFTVFEENGRIKIQIKCNGRDVSFVPEEISGMILSKLKEFAEEKTGKVVERAVITVPAYFTDAQRQATKAAASLAGLKVLRIVNEPTAAAFAFNMTNHIDRERFVLIFDLGGGTFDVSVLKIYKGRIRVLSKLGDNHLGGVDFDKTLLDYCTKDFQIKNKINLRECGENSRRHIARLRNACKNAKITLSTAPDATISIDRLHENLDYQITIVRSRFESLNKDLFQRCMDTVDRCIDMVPSEDKFDKSLLEIVLVGGSTRIPKIMELLKGTFPNQTQHIDMNRDESVAHGAAIYAHILLTSELTEVIDESLIDVTPLSLGIASRGGMMSVIIPKNEQFPTSKTKTYSNAIDNQKAIIIKVYEGERTLVEDNDLLAEFQLTDIPLGKKGTIKIDVKFEVDANSILMVTAVEQSTRQQQKIIVFNNKRTLSDEDIQRIKKDNEAEQRDREIKETTLAKDNLKKYIEDMRNDVKDKSKYKLSDEQIAHWLKEYEVVMTWLNDVSSKDKTEYINKKEKLVNEFTKMIKGNN